MILMLTATIMYWSLQQSSNETESSPSSVTTTPKASPEPSVNGDHDKESVGPEISNLSFDDAASDTTVTSTVGEYDTAL